MSRDEFQGYSFYSIPDKMRFAKTRNENGKSAIEWLVERYAVTKDSKSLIVNDCNAWAKEHARPRYIFSLLLSVISLSSKAVALANSLPTLSV